MILQDLNLYQVKEAWEKVCKTVENYLMSTKGTYLKSWLPNDQA